MASSLRKAFAALVLPLSFMALITLAPSSHAQTTFYLDLKIGCYSGNKTVTKYLKWSSPNYKKLYERSCNQSFHYQVYHLGALNGTLKGQAAQSEAQDKCLSALEELNAQIRDVDSVGIGWFFPDLGKEQSRYGKRLICFLRMVSDASFDRSVRQGKPILSPAGANT